MFGKPSFDPSDITDMAWIEINTPEDLHRAHEVIEPALHDS